jgi:hypothetical protein
LRSSPVTVTSMPSAAIFEALASEIDFGGPDSIV